MVLMDFILYSSLLNGLILYLVRNVRMCSVKYQAYVNSYPNVVQKTRLPTRKNDNKTEDIPTKQVIFENKQDIKRAQKMINVTNNKLKKPHDKRTRCKILSWTRNTVFAIVPPYLRQELRKEKAIMLKSFTLRSLRAPQAFVLRGGSLVSPVLLPSFISLVSSVSLGASGRVFSGAVSSLDASGVFSFVSAGSVVACAG